MNLREKNRAIVRLTADIAHFDADRELLASITPMHPAVTEPYNRFTKSRIHAKVIYALLNHVAPEEVFKNRFQQPDPPVEDGQQEPPKEDQQPEPPVEDGQQELPKEDQQPEPPVEDGQQEPPKEDQQPEPPVEDGQQEPPKEDQQPEPPVEDQQPEPPKEEPSKKKVNTKSSPE